ncbi:MAG: T9SS type A sorting domain-containing protein [Bacteroidetes bacterium]|nr:T9SS type A sorting domain-containing protein [Bacteroidota bacterium]
MFTLYEMTGRKLAELNLPGPSGLQTLDIAALPQGIYFYQITEQGITKASGTLTKH